jgi:hypothetical protein
MHTKLQTERLPKRKSRYTKEDNTKMDLKARFVDVECIEIDMGRPCGTHRKDNTFFVGTFERSTLRHGVS